MKYLCDTCILIDYLRGVESMRNPPAMQVVVDFIKSLREIDTPYRVEGMERSYRDFYAEENALSTK